MEINRLFDFLTKQVSTKPNQDFLSSKVTTANGKEWKTHTFQQVQDYVNRTSQLLLNLGVKKGDKIAIIATNRTEWNWVDLGCLQIGAVDVPMYPTVPEKDYEFIFNDAGVKYVFVGDDMIYQKVMAAKASSPTVLGVYTFDKVAGAKHFETELPQQVDTAQIQQLKDSVNENDLATIIYTSGTTGNPKGVMLSHKNITSNVHSSKEVTPFIDNEKALSFLPLCHSYERMVFYSYLSKGIHIYYAESMDTIGENLREVQPYCFTAVPRVLEKVYGRIMEKGNALTGFKRTLFFWSIDLGLKYEIGDRSWWYNFQLAIARKLVFSKWHEALGGRVRFITTGSAPMQPRLIRLFTAADVVVIEGYGLTETSPVLCANRFDETDRCIGTVGLPIPDVQIKIAEDGEILAKGPNLMQGYYNRPDLTAEAIDKDGWFHTGDIGEFVQGRFLKITDRKKELFKTSGGKYVAPQVIENKMKESRFIEQIMVVGESKNFVSALIVPSFMNLQSWAKENGVKFESNEQIIKNDKVKAAIDAEVQKLNENFGRWEQIKKFVLLPQEWTVESGDLTPSMKVKRKVIMERCKPYVEQLYKDENAMAV